jgi:ribosome-associated toxin RatA of RatAB toxin-antitoxin module
MASQHIEKSGEIDAPVEQVYRVVADVVRYPEFLPGVEKVARLEADIVEMTVRLGPIDITWKSRATFRPNESIVIELVEGPFRQMDVKWEFTPQGDRTRARYATDFELNLRLPAIHRIAARAIEANADATIEAFRRRVLSL